MDHPFPPELDFSYQLPRDMFHHLILSVTAALPAPIPDTEANRIRRDNAALARIAAMLPANADEADIAGMVVLATAQARECLRRANLHEADPPLAAKFTAQSTTMLREARAARSLLLRVQALRLKREADNVAREQAAWIEHSAIGLMADALGRTPPAPMAEPLPPVPEPAMEPPPDDDKFRRYTEPEQYVLIHERRARLIRKLGGLPAKCDFGAPSPEIVHAIVTGTSPIFTALDGPEASKQE